MVDALVSGASAERRVGSSPILGTSKEFSFQKAPFSFAQNRARSACGASADLSAVGCCLLRKYSCLLCDCG